ncbi:LytTR family DNA-binding domain-containing protein [Sphingomonas bacterium]|uniref:LytTR family DNA-binding domain-containing protein n=1 Tax=Sphingomonas bacterium TaxID=1895847 RepID=UPI002639CDC4|nr:LytTR family DNA-binding domain-containing protein [Sphingomonas bacterium]MDB5678245.1 LytTR family transcriptional regulator [Sphingomonas bacterium]
MATLSPDQPDRRRRRNRGFAKPARKFVDSALALPGFTMLMLGGGAAIVLATIMGAFGTIELPFGTRLGFWSVLIGWNMAKWLMWFAWWIRGPQDWRRAAAIGAVVVNLPLPLEIPAALWLFGIAGEIDPARTWIEAGVISATLFIVLFFARAHPAPATLPEDGILFRAGVRDLAAVQNVTAEDHYCRLHLAGGAKPLILARFADVLAELGGVDGEQIHRGAWVAASAVDGAVREGRVWRLVLADGTRLPVSASHVAAVRTRGWLRLKPKLGVA